MIREANYAGLGDTFEDLRGEFRDRWEGGPPLKHEAPSCRYKGSWRSWGKFK